MVKKFKALIKAGHRAPFFSPVGFLWRAVLLFVVLLIASALGLREYTSLISGTSSFHTFGARWRIILGCAYIILYLSAVVLGPILVIASGILWVFGVRGTIPAAASNNSKTTP